LPTTSRTEAVEIRALNLPIFRETFGSIPYGRVILATFDPDSQYGLLMTNIAAAHVKAGGDLLYIISLRPVSEIRQQFDDLGVNIAEYEAKDNAVLFDAYSAPMGVKTSEKYHTISSNLNELSITITQSATQWSAGTLVIVESYSNMAFNQENIFTKFWRRVAGVWRNRGSVMIVGLGSDLHPPQFYQDMKLVSDGAFEVKLKEDHGEIINTIRARSMKGQGSDTRLRQVLFDNKMKASLRLLE